MAAVIATPAGVLIQAGVVYDTARLVPRRAPLPAAGPPRGRRAPHSDHVPGAGVHVPPAGPQEEREVVRRFGEQRAACATQTAAFWPSPLNRANPGPSRRMRPVAGLTGRPEVTGNDGIDLAF
ncbi:hypothetical protein [Streptomyces sp. 2A115]|uniref:hypothetical protein n=1 Tax=Streptomyces sp. 2A115 TaxID=3457439 RepID=UPI003FD5B9A5